jgi:hypothetical protein
MHDLRSSNFSHVATPNPDLCRHLVADPIQKQQLSMSGTVRRRVLPRSCVDLRPNVYIRRRVSVRPAHIKGNSSSRAR